MGAPERNRINQILVGLPPEKRLFRINAGMGWAGKIVQSTPDALILKNPRPFHGAPEGWSDLVGWETVVITPEMVGQRVAIATAVEVKVTGRLTRAQGNFGHVLEQMGGRFSVDQG